MASIHLKELVEEIRRQLEEIDRERAGRGAEPFLDLQGVDLELKFTVAKSESGKGGFDLKVISAGGEEQERNEAVQTVTIHYVVDPEYRGFGGRAHRSTKGRENDQGIEPLG